jgi:uncharacterized protein YbaP (TraB family)
MQGFPELDRRAFLARHGAMDGHNADMKRLLRALGWFFLAVSASAFAQGDLAEHPDQPFLWKIEGKELKKTSYLFGTIHLGGGKLANLHPAAESAFQQCEVLATEIPCDAPTQMKMALQLMRKDQKKLSESIGKDRLKLVEAELKAIQPQLDLTPFEPMKTWVLAVTLPMLKSQLAGEEAMDATLWNRATKMQKSTSSIETADSQLALFEQFDESEQLALLDETLRTMKKDRDAQRDSSQEMVDAYLSGDLQAIKKEIDKSIEEMRQGPNKELGERFYRQLLTERDASMAKSIAKKLSQAPEKSHFFAAGAAHFAGETSIISHLEALGYKVTRIKK